MITTVVSRARAASDRGAGLPDDHRRPARLSDSRRSSVLLRAGWQRGLLLSADVGKKQPRDGERVEVEEFACRRRPAFASWLRLSAGQPGKEKNRASSESDAARLDVNPNNQHQSRIANHARAYSVPLPYMQEVDGRKEQRLQEGEDVSRYSSPLLTSFSGRVISRSSFQATLRAGYGVPTQTCCCVKYPNQPGTLDASRLPR